MYIWSRRAKTSVPEYVESEGPDQPVDTQSLAKTFNVP